MIWSVLAALWVSQDMETVALSGTIDSEQPGQVRIELLRTQGPDQNTLLLWSGWVSAPGAYRVEVPAGLQSVMLRAALDLKRDGVGPDDPQIRVPLRLQIGRDDLVEVDLQIRPPEHRSPALPVIPRDPGPAPVDRPPNQ